MPNATGGGVWCSVAPPTTCRPARARPARPVPAGRARARWTASSRPPTPTARRSTSSPPTTAAIDVALAALYDRPAAGERGRAGRRSGGLGRSRPGVVRWLGDIRRYFPTPVVRVLQRDAIERLDLRELLLEPELLQSVEPDLHLVTLLVELNRVLPDETRATARQVIASVLADLERRLTDHTRQAVRGALARSARTRSAAARPTSTGRTRSPRTCATGSPNAPRSSPSGWSGTAGDNAAWRVT